MQHFLEQSYSKAAAGRQGVLCTAMASFSNLACSQLSLAQDNRLAWNKAMIWHALF
jgi:hypothetical protein